MKLNRSTIKSLCLAFWLMFMAELLIFWPTTYPGRLLAVVTVILVTHIIYAGYFLICRLPQIDSAAVTFVSLIGLAILMLPPTLSSYQLVDAIFVVIFALAFALHWHSLRQNISPKLNQLCRYKLKLELGIIALIAMQAALVALFPDFQIWLGWILIIVLLAGDGVIFFRHKLYRQLA